MKPKLRRSSTSELMQSTAASDSSTIVVRSASRADSTSNAINGRLGLSIKEFTSAFGISRTVTYDLLASGKLARLKIGRRTIITAQSVNRLLQEANHGR